LREGLHDLGYVEGKTIAATALWPKTPAELPELAGSLVKQDVELIVAPSTPAVVALKPLTQTIPLVLALAADPVGSGLVANLARSGGNITGLSQLNIDLSGKRVELLHEASAFQRAVVLWSPETRTSRSKRWRLSCGKRSAEAAPSESSCGH
jgi:putative ABC transport system substrate-binding protein